MQQKEKSYQLLSPRFNDPLFEEQWYLVSYSLFCLFSAVVKKNKILYIDLKFLKLTIVWLTKLKLMVHLFYLLPPPPPTPFPSASFYRYYGYFKLHVK